MLNLVEGGGVGVEVTKIPRHFNIRSFRNVCPCWVCAPFFSICFLYLFFVIVSFPVVIPEFRFYSSVTTGEIWNSPPSYSKYIFFSSDF